MTDGERDHLLRHLAHAVRSLVADNDVLRHEIHILQERLLILDARILCEEVEDLPQPGKLN